MRTTPAKVFGHRVTAPSARKPSQDRSNTISKRKSLIDLQAIATDRRKYRRIKVRLSGRFMRENQQEHPCYTNDISAGGINLSAAVNCEPGEYIVLYIEAIGRLEGYVVRNHDDGFAVSIEASEYKREKLVASLTWILNRHELEGAEARRHERQIPESPTALLVLEDGREIQAKVLDLSVGGARIRVNANLKTGEKVHLGKSIGYIVRVGNDDIAIQFDTDHHNHLIHPFL
jgi:c-di-GMP-binding flagellar brake protein YcgR